MRGDALPDWIERVATGDMVDNTASRFGVREALTFEGQRWSFAQLTEDIDFAARGLRQLGIQAGEKVTLWNSSPFFPGLFRG